MKMQELHLKWALSIIVTYNLIIYELTTIHTMVNKVVLSHLANPLNPLNKILTFNLKTHISLNVGYTKTL